MESERGTFYAVGVGPGDPELMTRKAVRVLEECPVLAVPRTPAGDSLALEIAQAGADLTDKEIHFIDFAMSRDEEKRRQAHRRAAEAVRALLDYDGPAYLRLGRLAVESVTDAIPGYTFHLGQGVTLRDGSDVTVIATGMMVQMALKAAESLAAEGLSVRVLDMHTIKPLDGELVLKAALETGAIVTTEEANVVGGLGSAVAEFLAEHHPVPVVRHGVNDVFGRSGKAEAVLEAYGLTPEGIAEKVRHAVKRKK